MKGKNCVVTGGNSGIGFETALALASLDAHLILLCRDEEKAKMAVKSIRAKTQNKNIDFVIADLSSQSSIKKAAKNILKSFDKIDVLVNNAGTWLSKLELTEDGVEGQFAVNHLAYFLLTHELLGALNKSKDARVICVGSDSHFKGKIHFDDLTLGKNYHGLKAYAQSKLANTMFVYEFDRQLKAKKNNHISINCVQPGLVKTDIGLKHTISLHSLAWKIRRLGGVSPAKGAETSVYLATSNEVKGQSGKYWDKSKSKPSSQRSYNIEDAARLWQMCMDFCRIKDYFSTIEKADQDHL